MDTIKTWYEALKQEQVFLKLNKLKKWMFKNVTRMYSTGYYNYNRDVRNILMASGLISQGPEYPPVPRVR
jgi:hypothetical protein